MTSERRFFCDMHTSIPLMSIPLFVHLSFCFANRCRLNWQVSSIRLASQLRANSY